MDSDISIYHDDCFNILRDIDTDSVDLVICDLPFGITNNPWDTQIDMEKLWDELLRIGHESTPFLFFGSTRFIPTILRYDPDNIFRYDIVWDKNLVTGFLNANRQPLRVHELILVFYRSQPTYNPQKTVGHMTHGRGHREETTPTYGDHGTSRNYSRMKYPKSIIEFSRLRKTLESTQKPLELLEWLIKTYSNEGDLVVDPTIGTGTTAVACANTGRDFVGAEIRDNMVKMAMERLMKREKSKKKVERVKNGF